MDLFSDPRRRSSAAPSDGEKPGLLDDLLDAFDGFPQPLRNSTGGAPSNGDKPDLVDNLLDAFDGFPQPPRGSTSVAPSNGDQPDLIDNLLDAFHGFSLPSRNSTSFEEEALDNPFFSRQPKVPKDSSSSGSNVSVEEIRARDLLSSDDQSLHHRGSPRSENDLDPFLRYPLSSASNKAFGRPNSIPDPTVRKPRISSTGSVRADEWAPTFAQENRGVERGMSSIANGSSFVDNGLLPGFSGITSQSSSGDAKIRHQSDPFPASVSTSTDDGLLSGFNSSESHKLRSIRNTRPSSTRETSFVSLDDEPALSTISRTSTVVDDPFNHLFVSSSIPSTSTLADDPFYNLPVSSSIPSTSILVDDPFNNRPVSSSVRSTSSLVDDPFNLFSEPQHPSSEIPSRKDKTQDPFDAFGSFPQPLGNLPSFRDVLGKSVGNSSSNGATEKTSAQLDFSNSKVSQVVDKTSAQQAFSNFEVSQAPEKTSARQTFSNFEVPQDSDPFFSIQSEVTRTASCSRLSDRVENPWDISSPVSHEGLAGSENDLEAFFGHSVSSSRMEAMPMDDSNIFGGPRNSSSVPPTSAASVDEWTSIFAPTQTSNSVQEDLGGTSGRSKRMQESRNRAAKAIDELKLRDQEALREQVEKERAADMLHAQIKRWANGKEGNLRALLASLQDVLWPECGWASVSLTDLIDPMAVKKIYKKATLFIHPDKVQQKGATAHQKYIAENVFDVLKEAWKKFNSEELF